MATYNKKLVSFDQDWGGDASTDNMRVSGRRIQEFIKEQIQIAQDAALFLEDVDDTEYTDCF
jgi:plasmid maintenance system antidote protein VapI